MAKNMNEAADFFRNINFLIANNEEELYKDRFVTEQQKKRDKQITDLLSGYVDFYKRKVSNSIKCRYVILIPCMLIICAFAGVLIAFSVKISISANSIQISDLVAFITACISFVSLIIGLLTIMTKYFFPENDEQYITTIVESIQRNDLENKRENAKYEKEKIYQQNTNQEEK